jgi:hypothetical protein
MKKLLVLFLFSMLSSSVFGIKIKVINNTNTNWTVRIYDSGLRNINAKKENDGYARINMLVPGEEIISEETTPNSTVQVTNESGKRTAVGGGQKITLRRDVNSNKNTTIYIEDERARGRNCPDPINKKPEHEREVGAGNTCFYVEEEQEAPILRM